MTEALRLVRPAPEHLHSFIVALERGWSPDTLRPAAGREQLARAQAEPRLFLASLEYRQATGASITLPDGSQVQRIPGFHRWMWHEEDSEFCGSINFRWVPGGASLPPHVLGHIGYAVVPWKQGRGFATRALALLLDEVRGEGLPYVTLTTDEDNLASQRVIEVNGGEVVERFNKPAHWGGKPSLRYRIALA